MVEKKPAAEKKASKGVNKSAEIRKLAAAMKEKGEKPRPVTIIALLKKQGIVVSSPQVSMVLKRMGFKPRKRRKAGAVAKAPKARAAASHLSVDDLIAAKKVVMGFGHRVYRAYDPRAAALRKVAEAMPSRPDWLDLAIGVEEVILRVFEEMKPGRAMKTNEIGRAHV